MISEGSYDIKNFYNCWKFSFVITNKFQFLNIFKIETFIYFIVIIFHNITVLVYFDQINAALVSIRDFFQKQV